MRLETMLITAVIVGYGFRSKIVRSMYGALPGDAANELKSPDSPASRLRCDPGSYAWAPLSSGGGIQGQEIVPTSHHVLYSPHSENDWYFRAINAVRK